jgi:tetratricopeptide (TPR) repeat protein
MQYDPLGRLMPTKKFDLDDIFQLALKEADEEQREVHVIEFLKYYLSQRPEHGRAWLTYGESLRLVGCYEEAMDALLTSLELARVGWSERQRTPT